MLYDAQGNVIPSTIVRQIAHVAPPTNAQRVNTPPVDATTRRERITTQSITNRDTIEHLLNKLSHLQRDDAFDIDTNTHVDKMTSRSMQKRVRARLRALNHFGGSQSNSSRYYNANAKTYDVDALIERDKRRDAYNA